MTLLVVGLVLFLGVHSTSIVGVRDRAVSVLGVGPWKGLYALVSLVGFAALVWGYGVARTTPTLLWVPPVWARHVALLVMLPVFPLLVAAYAPGRIQGFVRHPMLVATLLWGAAHLLANGMLHDVVLFAAFVGWAALDLASFAWRDPRAVPGAPPGRWNDAIAVVVGLGLYAGFVLGLHEALFGVAPIAGP